MAWTSPATVTTGQLMTAAFWNQQVRDNMAYLQSSDSAFAASTATFSNASYADLDALTGTPGSAVAVTLETDATAMVVVTAQIWGTANMEVFVSYRVSGATTIASSDARALYHRGDGGTNDRMGASWVSSTDALTPGTNTFEAQARTTGADGNLKNTTLLVRTM